MAIVGTAYVRLRVIGDKLKGDISKSTENAVKDSAPALKASGEKVGDEVGKGAGEKLKESVGTSMGKVADDIGTQIGDRMAANLGKSLRRRAGDQIKEGIGSARSRLNSIGDQFKGTWEKIGKQWSSHTGKSFTKNLKGLMVTGIAGLITILPSIIAFGAAVGTSLVATLVPAIASLGPAAAGAGFAFVGAFSAMKISAGLVGLALKYPSDALEDFKKRTEDFKGLIAAPIQTGLLSGLNASMRMLSPAVKALEPELAGLGNAVGDVAIGFADAVRQGVMMDRIRGILQTNNQFVRDAGSGVSAFGQSFIILLNALRPVTQFLGELIRDIGEWTLRTTEAGESSGRLQAFVTRAFDALRYFVGILVDFGVGIWNVFQAAHGASGGMLNTLQGIADRFREWTGSEEGQARMTKFFENMRIIAGRVLQIVGELSGAAGGAMEGIDVQSVLTGLDNLVAVGKSVGQMFEQIRAAAGPQMGEAFTNLVQLITDLANSGVLGTMTTAFANLFSTLSYILNIPGVGQLLAIVAGFAAMFTTLKLLWTIFRPIMMVFNIFRIALVAVAGVVGWIPVVIGLLIAALIWFFTQTEVGRNIISAVWDFIKNAISAAVDWIIGAWNWMVSAFQTAVAWVVNLAQQIWSAISTAFNAVVSVVSTVFTTIWSVISTVLGVIWTVISTWLNIVWTIWSTIFTIMLIPLRILWGVAILIWQGIVAAVTWAVGLLWGIITTVWNAIWGFIQPILQGIWDFIVGVWNGIVGAIQGAMDWIWGIISGVWNMVTGWIDYQLTRIKIIVQAAWAVITEAIGNALDKAWNVIKSVWDKITGFVSGALDFLKGLVQGAWDALGDIGQGILSGLKSAVNVVIDGINMVIDGLNWAIDLANKLPGPDIGRIPRIPRLAQGGVVSPAGGGTLAMIAEAGRAERVEPLDPQGLSVRDRALIDQLSGGTGDTTVIVKIGETELRGIVSTEVQRENTGLAKGLATGRKRVA